MGFPPRKNPLSRARSREDLPLSFRLTDTGDRSTRAYRSRFDRWGIAKYNCQRHRNSIASTSWSVDSPPAAGMMNRGPFLDCPPLQLEAPFNFNAPFRVGPPPSIEGEPRPDAHHDDW
jgi:hypothetical protein